MDASIDSLRRGFTGSVVLPGEPGYEEARTIFNSMIDRKPAVIAQCASNADVAAAIAFGRASELPIAVRSGGHSVVGASIADRGLVIDMRRMNDVSVDVAAKTVRCGGGATWGVVDQATQSHGLATTGGRVSSTGVAGLTLGGGSGWVERKFGLACDNLRAVELVTAQGETVRASATENPELFWGLHGGGGNFGVATAFEFDLHPLTEFTVGLLLYRREKAKRMTRVYRDFAATAPDEVGGGMAYITAPPHEFVPEQFRGTVMFGVIFTYVGPHAEAEKILKPVLDAEEPDVNVFMPAPYAEFQHMLDDPPGFRNYWAAQYLDDLPDEALDTFISFGERQKPSPTQLILLPWGGAVARVSDAETPMSKRQAPWVFHPLCLWEGPENDSFWINFARESSDSMKRFSSGGVYLNFVGDEAQDRMIEAFGQDNYERLATLKRRFDPDNVFRLNANIRPASA